jgi:hypothetical protein
MFDIMYTFLETIVQRLEAQKLLVFYFLDYPTKVIPNFNNNNNNNKNTFDSILCSKENLRKHMIGHELTIMYSHVHTYNTFFTFFLFFWATFLGL